MASAAASSGIAAVEEREARSTDLQVRDSPESRLEAGYEHQASGGDGGMPNVRAARQVRRALGLARAAKTRRMGSRGNR